MYKLSSDLKQYGAHKKIAVSVFGVLIERYKRLVCDMNIFQAITVFHLLNSIFIKFAVSLF